MIKKRKKPIIYIFYWFGRTRSFAYVPVRDQNLVVRGKNFVWFVLYFLFVFEKGFKVKRQVAKWNWFVFFILKKKKLKVELKLIWNLIKKENKKGNHLILDQGLLYIKKKLWFLIMWMFFVVFE